MDLCPDVYREILESLPIGIYIIDRDRKILFWNDGAERITGYLRQEIIGRKCFDGLLRHCDDSHTLLCQGECATMAAMRSGKPREARVYLHHRNGELVSVSIHAQPVRDEHGSVVGAVELFTPHDSATSATLSANDPSDERTGLPNREATQVHLHERLELFQRDHEPFGVLLVTLDSLETFRHAYGRAAVDKVLHAVARTLQGGVHPTDLVGQWNECGFLVLLAGVPAAGLAELSEILKSHVHMADIRWWGDRLAISVTIGATLTVPGDTYATMTARFESAVAEAQRGGGNVVTVV